MSEIAIVSARRSRLEQAAKKGDKGAKIALELSDNPSKLLSTVQIGITLIGLLTGIYGGDKIASQIESQLIHIDFLKDYVTTLSFSITLILITFFSLVLGELLPKRIGLIMPERIAKLVSAPMKFLSRLTAPFIWLLMLTTDLLMKTFNIKRPENSLVTQEEIKAIIKEGTVSGALEEIEHDIVENVFHLSDRKISSLMTSRQDIEWIDLNDSEEKIKELLIKSSHIFFPLCDGNLDKITGLIKLKDVLKQVLEKNIINLKLIQHPAFFLPENMMAYKAMEELQKTNHKFAVIVDEFGDVSGVLTLHDLAQSLVGNIDDQLHLEEQIVPRNDGSYLIDGSIPLADFSRYFELDISDNEELDNINTLGGLVYQEAKNIPQTGYSFRWYNLTIEVIDMDGRRVDKLLVKENV